MTGGSSPDIPCDKCGHPFFSEHRWVTLEEARKEFPAERLNARVTSHPHESWYCDLNSNSPEPFLVWTGLMADEEPEDPADQDFMESISE